MNKWNQIKLLVLNILGAQALPVKDGKLELKEEDKVLLAQELGQANFEKVVELAEQEFAIEGSRQKTINELNALLKEHSVDPVDNTDPNADTQGTEGKPDLANAPAKTEAQAVAELRKLLEAQGEQLRVLRGQPDVEEFERVAGTATKNGKLPHSKSHVFGIAKSYNEIAGRPWNQRMVNPSIGATNYTNLDFTKINTDFQDYWATEKDEIITYIRSMNRLPSWWNTISNIDDQMRYAQVLLGEVTQARKKAYLPKGDFEFQPRIGQVYPIQIDLTFQGSQLQEMETSWMNRYNNAGSSPFKMSFVGYLMGEILKKAFEEDQLALIKGVHVPTASNATTPSKQIHKLTGLRKVINKAILDREYMAYDLGLPTDENIYDYVRSLILRVPEYWRDLPNMKLYMSIDWSIKYHNKRELLKGTNQDYNGEKSFVDQFENVQIVPLHFFQGSNRMFLTTPDNISILENIPNENANFKMQEEKRDIHMFADYKKGIHVHAFGKKWAANDTMTDEAQMFFSNDVEDLTDVYVDVPANTATPSALYHNVLKTGVNTGATAITNILDSVEGQFYYIWGNTGTASTIANSGNFVLTGAITLSDGIGIKLIKHATGKFVEVARYSPSAEYITLAEDATTANGTLGTKFTTVANTEATAITNITNAVAGTTYTFLGGSSTNATTIASGGNFLLTAGMTLSAAAWIKVLYTGSKFVEVSRSA
jgi:hypothetical protein